MALYWKYLYCCGLTAHQIQFSIIYNYRIECEGKIIMKHSLPEDYRAIADEIRKHIVTIQDKTDDVDKAVVDKYGSFCEYYAFLRVIHDLNNSEIIKRGDIERSYYYQIMKGNRNPSRDKVLRICIGAKLDQKEASHLLLASDYSPLYEFRIRDLIIMTALTKQLDVVETNMLLDEFGVETLK